MAEHPEQKYYSSIFQKTDVGNTGRIEGRQAVALFRTSGVAVQTLKTIWELATPNKEDFLDKNRFFVALKLVALAQEGKPVNIQMLHEKVGLPKFEGIELPVMPDEWEISENDMNVYVNGFKKLSGDKGFLTAAESKELLQRTQFAPDVLKRIWTAVGLGNGNMNCDQFCVSMQLIAKARAGIEIPEALPASLDKIINKKVKEEPKQQEIRVRDPEPTIDVPKPISQSTLGDDFDSPKKQLTVPVRVSTEKTIKEKEKIAKEKTHMLKSISELMEVDEAELELVKEKNKILEEKLRESQENFEKIKKKVSKSKEKFEKVLTETHEQIQKLQKENEVLKVKKESVRQPEPVYKPAEVPISMPEASVIKPADIPAFKQELPASRLAEPIYKPVEVAPKVPERSSDENKIPKKEIGFEFDSFFKDPFPTKPKEEEKPVKPVSDPKPVSDQFFAQGFKTETKPESNLFPALPKPDPKPQPTQIDSKPKTDNSLFPAEFSAFKFEGFPQAKPRKDDVFGDIDTAPPVKEVKHRKKSSSSGSDKEKKPSAEFGFKFSEDFEKKIEKPVEFKPEPASFGAGFGDFGKNFNFAGAVPSFDDNFFKMDAKPVQSKGKSREIEFD